VPPGGKQCVARFHPLREWPLVGRFRARFQT
jgi:hypothetical protein